MEKIITKENAIVFLILLAFTFVLFYRLGENYLTHWDEAWHADVSRNIVKSGNFWTLTWNGQPFFDKPPLYFWFSAIVMKFFGVTELSARFPSALSAFGVGVVLYFLARLLSNQYVALFALIVLASTIGFLFRVRTGNLDGLLTLWILFSIFAFYKGYLGKSVRWYVLMGIAIGLAFLTKGAIAFVFPVICFFYLFARKEPTALKLLILSIGIGVGISLVWLLLSILAHGQEFVSGFFSNQIGKVSTKAAFWQHFSFEYVSHMKSGLKIWFIPFSIFFFPILMRWKNTKFVLLIFYFLIFFTVLSFSENKSNWFLMPLYPITALMVGYGLAEVARLLTKKGIIFVVIFTLLIFYTQLFIFRQDYIVLDTVGDEARVALAAKENTAKNKILYLTNYYYPSTVYYSERKVYAVYSEHEQNSAWWIKPKTDWKKILKERNVAIVTTLDELDELQREFPDVRFTILFQSGSKLLVEKL